MASSHTGNSGNPLEHFVPFNIPVNREALKEAAMKNLGETEDLKQRCLKQLKKLIKDANVACITRDDFLLRFLRTKKFDVERSFQMVKNYAQQRAELHARFLQLQPGTLKSFLRHDILGLLPYRDSEGRLILFVVIRYWNRDDHSIEEVVRVLFLVLYYLAEDDSSQVNGLNVVVDALSTPWSNLPYALKHAWTISNVSFNGLPMRYTAMHCINENPVLKLFYRLVQPLIPKKLKERIYLHGESREILLQQISPVILPNMFGGSFGPLKSDHLEEEFLNFLEKFKSEHSYFLPKKV